MKNVINIDETKRAFLTSELGDLISKGMFKQVGIIRTEFVDIDNDGVTRLVTAVIHDAFLSKYYEVDQYRGVSIRAEIRDEDILEKIAGILPTLEEGEGFIIDQRVAQSAEEYKVKPADESQLPPAVDGTPDE